MKYNFKRMTPTAKLPTRHTPVSAGVDFYADEDAVIYSKSSAIISTGINWNPLILNFVKNIHGIDIFEEAFPGYAICLVIQSRSGYAFRLGIEASNAGVIDQDYIPHEKENAIIRVKLYNHSKNTFYVYRGDKVCQGVPQLIPYMDDVETLDVSRYGQGFGSSDKKEN